MKLTRRTFLKVSGATVAGLSLSGVGFGFKSSRAYAAELRTKGASVATTICPYCSVSCSILAHAVDGKIINTEGDPDAPINRGALCSKGASLYHLAVNDDRVTKPLYREPYGKEWKEVSWNWALDEIAKLAKKSRDASFVEKNAKGETVNRTEGIASVGSAARDNEECYIYQKFLRGLGLTYIEHQARLCHSSTVPALAESFGRGAMTNHYIDIGNSDCIMVMGGNSAETHPVAFKWVMKAIENGATLIHCDPRFTRTSSKAHIYARLRSGTDIAFLGGMIKYILDNDLIDKFYVQNYTNASFLINKDFKFDDGLFSGYNPETRKYDKATWEYQKDADGVILKDPTLQDPNCVYQLLKKHYSRYDVDKVISVTGTAKEDLMRVYKAYTATAGPGKSATIMYAMGWTQHTVGVQNIRAMSMIQLLLGNIGVAGGGVNALRGESNVQGSTDFALLFHIFPGYLKAPLATLPTLADNLKTNTPTTKEPQSLNWWSNTPKYTVSLLKAFFGDAATKDNDFGYGWWPKNDAGADYSWLNLFDQMSKGKFSGFFAWGMNPACSGANAGKVRKALGQLDWMVNVNLFPNETGQFWKGPGMDPAKVKTAVFMLPCAACMEKEGSIINSGRWSQWRYKCANPPGQAMPDGEIIDELQKRIKALYKKEGGAFPAPVVNLAWDYEENGHFSVRKIAREINGYYTQDVAGADGATLKKGTQVANFVGLKDDGSTVCGNWLYGGSYPEAGNMLMRRDNVDASGIGLYSNWAWCWPLNRRIVYNRSSVDFDGNPRRPEMPVIKWDGSKWVGDVADNAAPPMSNKEAGKLPYIMNWEGVARLFGPGLADGPFPEHYEPLECPVEKNAFSAQRINPVVKLFNEKGEGEGKDVYLTCDPRYPIVCSTYRVVEHWQTGLMTRWNKQLVELMPQNFVEISKELAALKGIKNGEMVIVKSPRGQIEAVANVTARFKPFTINGQTVHQVGTTWHFGWCAPVNGGDSANLLTPTVGDANTLIPESKAFMVNIERKG
jgi:formate dehydrogenase major subunit